MYKHIRCIFLFVLFTGIIYSRPHRVGQIPNGSENGCANCHVNPAGGGERNMFGKLVESKFLAGDDVAWGPLLAHLDADGDGVSNGAELQDPFGAWTIGQPAPGNSSLVTLPGVSSSVNYGKVTLNFSSMDPHVGNMLSARAVNKNTGKEDGRALVMINSPGFSLEIDSLMLGDSYLIDFFADLNNNGKYDAPPADHAWRISVDAVGENTEAAFIHNTNFTDINWKYLLTFNNTSFNPHLNQLYEFRIVESGTNKEVFRKRIESVLEPNFMVKAPVIEEGKEYVVEAYADHNNNKFYDVPPTDHAWRLPPMTLSGDTSVVFQHNTNFTDINWKYALHAHFLNMTPHLGQLFEIRAYNNSGEEEISRFRLDSVLSVNFNIDMPGIENGQSYNIDFYADHNNSGVYDAPPTDHAWRLEISGQQGDAALNFIHNTSFTDIGWTPIGIEEDDVIPAEYSLAQNYPNPFNPVTMIRFTIPKNELVTIKIYDILGREAAVLLNREMSAGQHELQFNASSFASGVYIYKISAGYFTETRKMNLLK